MLRSLMIPAFALGLMALGSGATPASASFTEVSGARNEQIFAHFHPQTSVGLSRYRFPPKKKK